MEKSNCDKTEIIRRRIVLVLFMTVTLGLLFGKVAQVSFPNLSCYFALNNKSLKVNEINDFTIEICGRGYLGLEDVATLISDYSVKAGEIESLIIGDEIESIGHMALSEFHNLSVVKFGESVKKIEYGNLHGLKNLKFVYFSNEIEDVDDDFLVDCYGVRVATDDSAEELPLEKLPDIVLPENVLYEIDSQEDLAAMPDSCRVIYKHYDAEQLNTNDEYSGEGPIVLSSGCTQFGPYDTIEAGAYFVCVRGSGFSELAEGFAHYNLTSTGESITSDVYDLSDTIVHYIISIPADDEIELCIENNVDGDSLVEIDGIEIYRYDDQIMNFLQTWWND